MLPNKRMQQANAAWQDGAAFAADAQVGPTTGRDRLIPADFYRLSESVLTPALGAMGWESTGRVLYHKRETLGVSRLALDPLKRFDRFRVLLTFDPSDLDALLVSLFADEPAHDRGFLCGPYLTPGGVAPRHAGYACRTRALLDASLSAVLGALADFGVPWLADLHDPRFLAEHADPVAALTCGYAWERAGDLERAHERYAEMWRRLEGGLAGLSPRALARLPDSVKRQYLFVTGRLGHDNDATRAFTQQLQEAGSGPTLIRPPGVN
jgi:hypothetical protein